MICVQDEVQCIDQMVYFMVYWAFEYYWKMAMPTKQNILGMV